MSVHTMETLALFDNEPYRRTFSARVVAVADEGVILEHSLFYPTGGGQPGDSGWLTLADGTEVQVLGTVRDRQLPSIIWHQVQHCPPHLCAGALVNARLDWERRYQHMKMHTCLHLLCSLIDAPVTGCSISADKGRLDFDLPEMTLDKNNLTHALNGLIEQALPVRIHPGPHATRRVDISGVDLQPCGGTHVANTAEIGRVYCEKIEKKSAHNRRVVLRFE